MGGSSSRRRSKSGSAAASTTSPTRSSRLGLRTGWVGGLNTSPMGRIVANHARAVGMDISHAVTRKYDGVGKVDRIGLNFTEVGHSKRASVTLYDRGHSATAGMKPGDVNWKKLFGEAGRPLAAHGRHLRRALRRHAQGRRRSGEGGARGRHDRQLRPQLPLQALVVDRGDRDDQAARAVHRLPDRQRRGLPEGARLRSRRRRRREGRARYVGVQGDGQPRREGLSRTSRSSARRCAA